MQETTRARWPQMCGPTSRWRARATLLIAAGTQIIGSEENLRWLGRAILRPSHLNLTSSWPSERLRLRTMNAEYHFQCRCFTSTMSPLISVRVMMQ